MLTHELFAVANLAKLCLKMQCKSLVSHV